MTRNLNQSKTEKSLLVIGECMMELLGKGNTYQRTFAGDVYNSAVYAKRRNKEIDVQILTAVGTDSVSAEMMAQWAREGIGHELVMISTTAHLGIYIVSTDSEGERTFTYWRKNSAATELMSLMTENTRHQLEKFDAIFFSGITLAILSDDKKADLLALIATLKAQGKTIAFDPNYRAVLWNSKDHAARWLSKAYQLADIALPGLADHKEVFGHKSHDDVRSFLQSFNIKEIIVKADNAGLFGHLGTQASVHCAITELTPLDTTGAGDSFAGTYLAERLGGVSMAEAMRNAAKIAGLVVQHRGAIVEAGLYQEFIRRGL
jgi:2-dehydro-3-deoxygluconokinase